jgi:tRNA(Ile2) C34 agmatinyltransferase TiaS
LFFGKDASQSFKQTLYQSDDEGAKVADKIDKTLINTLTVLARKEKKVREFKGRVRVKGKIVKKGLTKKGNIRLTVQKGEGKYNFIIIKSHKDDYALAEKLAKGSFVNAEGINKFRAIICTKLKKIQRIETSEQKMLIEQFHQ